MSAVEKILERFDAVELPSGHYQIAFVTPEEFKAALAEAWEAGKQDTLTFVMYSNADDYANPWRKS